MTTFVGIEVTRVEMAQRRGQEQSGLGAVVHHSACEVEPAEK